MPGTAGHFALQAMASCYRHEAGRQATSEQRVALRANLGFCVIAVVAHAKNQ
ncbi:hypothetical protein XOCgx_2621 [Xanthomonas oryzae pv. oryzicola]|nr:hypothetical protein XOCgx_2621 [Xanthomonas oryzae pv. oryzicola]